MGWFVTEALQGLMSVPIPGTFDLPEGWVLLDPQEGPFCWVPGHRVAAGLSAGWLWLMWLLLALLRLFVLGGCFRRTWVWPYHKGPHLLQQPLHGEVTARFWPRYWDYRGQSLLRPVRRLRPLLTGRRLPVLWHWPQNSNELLFHASLLHSSSGSLPTSAPSGATSVTSEVSQPSIFSNSRFRDASLSGSYGSSSSSLCKYLWRCDTWYRPASWPSCDAILLTLGEITSTIT